MTWGGPHPHHGAARGVSDAFAKPGGQGLQLGRAACSCRRASSGATSAGAGTQPLEDLELKAGAARVQHQQLRARGGHPRAQAERLASGGPQAPRPDSKQAEAYNDDQDSAQSGNLLNPPGCRQKRMPRRRRLALPGMRWPDGRETQVYHLSKASCMQCGCNCHNVREARRWAVQLGRADTRRAGAVGILGQQSHCLPTPVLNKTDMGLVRQHPQNTCECE